MWLSTYQTISVAAALLLITPLSPALAETPQRSALVIGNADYRVSPLKNPGNDAADVAAALRKLGFDVALHVDADQRTMERAIRAFGKRLRRNSHPGHAAAFSGSLRL